MTREAIDLWGESIDVVFLNGLVVKNSSKYLYLKPQICAVLNLGQRSFLFQRVVVNIMTVQNAESKSRECSTIDGTAKATPAQQISS